MYILFSMLFLVCRNAVPGSREAKKQDLEFLCGLRVYLEMIECLVCRGNLNSSVKPSAQYLSQFLTLQKTPSGKRVEKSSFLIFHNNFSQARSIELLFVNG